MKGKTVWVLHNGKWVPKYVHKSHADAIQQLRALYANDPHASAR